jgi:DNA polymerase-1
MISGVAERLYLIDGMSHLYRAYYAIRGLTDRKGRPTNAVYGFTNMLRKLIAEETPEYLGVAVDLPGPTVRHEQFEDYKATRRPTPEDLTAQIPYARQVCEVLRVPILSFERYEADDVIGTLTDRAVEEGLEVVIVTIDKDMFQLVSDKVSILDTRDMSVLDSVGVEKKFGVAPTQVVDVLSLVGDSSDNIPGAPGIGKKGAIQLISEFGTLEELLKSSDQVQRKSYRESLQNSQEQILQSQELVKIHRSLPLSLDLPELKLSEPDRGAARELFTELNFVTLLDEFLPSTPEMTRSYEPVGSMDVLQTVLGGKEKVALSVSVGEGNETAPKLEGLAFAFTPGDAWFATPEFLAMHAGDVGRLLSKAQAWVLHDSKKVLRDVVSLGWDTPKQISDTMLSAYLLNPNQNDFGLSRLSVEHLQRKLLETPSGQTGLFDMPDGRVMAEEADVILQLARSLAPQLEANGLGELLREIEQPLVSVLTAMEKIGVKVDCAFLESMSEDVGITVDRLSTQIYELAGEEFNINSPKQLSQILFEKLQLPVIKKTRKAGHYATGVEVLETLAKDFEIASEILHYRELTKLKSTYLDALPQLVNPKTARIHTSYNQMVAATGRLSSSNPNLQNIPIKSDLGREIRKAFVAEEGCEILAADYSQIELRVMAHLSRDPVLLDAFRKGEDIHERTAREVFGSEAEKHPEAFRRHAKVVNFGIMYGLSAFGLSQSLKIERKEAQKFIDDYFIKYSGVKEWIETTLEQARETGVVRTLFGRIRPIPEIQSKNWNVRNFGERTAINAPIQGTAADLIKKAMITAHNQVLQQGLKSRLILQVHDELIFEVPEAEVEEMRTLVRENMENAAQLDIPLKVDLAVGNSWYEAKSH